jgi:hypothetical protein
MKTDKRSPHARLTVEEVKAQYKAGLLRVTGYLYNWLLASKREGWRVRSSVAKLSEELGICRAAFYKAISKLKGQSLVNFEIHGDIEIWIESFRVRALLVLVDLHSPRLKLSPIQAVEKLSDICCQHSPIASPGRQPVPNRNST